jgi:hypothetical protein
LRKEFEVVMLKPYDCGGLLMTGFWEVLEILGVLLAWLGVSIYVAPRVKGGFS